MSINIMDIKTAVEAFCALMGINLQKLIQNLLSTYWDRFVDFISQYLHLAWDFVCSLDWMELLNQILDSIADIAATVISFII